MKIAFVLLLVALTILPATIIVRLRLARARREMAEQERGGGPESGD
jgi:hypothetical protein